MTKQEKLERRVQILKALAHPSRLMMVNELAEGEFLVLFVCRHVYCRMVRE